MYTFTHSYRNKQIKFTVDVLGGEALYVNNKLVSHSNKWTLKNSHHFAVDGHPLVLQIKANSLMAGECEVTIFDNDKVVYNQIQVFDLSMDGQSNSFNQDELRWKKDIEFPCDILNLAWLFYFIMIAAGIATFLVQSQVTEHISIFIISMAICYAIYKMFRSIFTGLKAS